MQTADLDEPSVESVAAAEPAMVVRSDRAGESGGQALAQERHHSREPAVRKDPGESQGQVARMRDARARQLTAAAGSETSMIPA